MGKRREVLVQKATITRADIQWGINGGFSSMGDRDRQSSIVMRAVQRTLPKGPYSAHGGRIAGRDCTDKQFYAGRHKQFTFSSEPYGHVEGFVRGEAVEFFLGVDEFNGHWQNAPCPIEFEVVHTLHPIGKFPPRCGSCHYFLDSLDGKLPTCDENPKCGKRIPEADD